MYEASRFALNNEQLAGPPRQSWHNEDNEERHQVTTNFRKDISISCICAPTSTMNVAVLQMFHRCCYYDVMRMSQERRFSFDYSAGRGIPISENSDSENSDFGEVELSGVHVRSFGVNAHPRNGYLELKLQRRQAPSGSATLSALPKLARSTRQRRPALIGPWKNLSSSPLKLSFSGEGHPTPGEQFRLLRLTLFVVLCVCSTESSNQLRILNSFPLMSSRGRTSALFGDLTILEVGRLKKAVRNQFKNGNTLGPDCRRRCRIARLITATPCDVSMSY
ncbi:hypothetical protein C8R45DRAFT_1184013 [Mycena sanguinolenta]|nr:hypothetical protein C8R45DRAFT_1138318 [Mycena sanguinolenta]KAJ6457937.1 hypothetical protein C8R45DRAFT_1184013 [Mycena sanguinolenta]